MKPDKRFCAHTKFKKVCLALQGDLKLTVKTINYLQSLVDNMMTRFFTLMHKNIKDYRKTIQPGDIDYLLDILALSGVRIRDFEDIYALLPNRIGYHILHHLNLKLRISKQAQQKIQKFYICCVGLIMELLKESLDITKEKRVTPELVTGCFQRSKFHFLV